MREWKCDECGTITPDSELLRADNPFDDPTGNVSEILGCPKCHGVECFALMCDGPGCTNPASCGFYTESGYRITCGEHSEI